MHPKDIHFDLRGKHQEIAVIRLTRAAKRNVFIDVLIASLHKVFEEMPASVRGLHEGKAAKVKNA